MIHTDIRICIYIAILYVWCKLLWDTNTHKQLQDNTIHIMQVTASICTYIERPFVDRTPSLNVEAKAIG